MTAKFPIVDLHAFRDRNFGLGSLFSFVLGIGLYGLTYLYPVYLAQIRGYNALMIGETLFVSGVFMFLTAPIAGRLMNKVDPRFMLITGFLFLAAPHFMDPMFANPPEVLGLPAGVVILAFGGFMMFIGFMLIRKIVDIEV